MFPYFPAWTILNQAPILTKCRRARRVNWQGHIPHLESLNRSRWIGRNFIEEGQSALQARLPLRRVSQFHSELQMIECPPLICRKLAS